MYRASAPQNPERRENCAENGQKDLNPNLLGFRSAKALEKRQAKRVGAMKTKFSSGLLKPHKHAVVQ
jgi:hypothetical protein